jgi:hypothetical protein
MHVIAERDGALALEFDRARAYVISVFASRSGFTGAEMYPVFAKVIKRRARERRRSRHADHLFIWPAGA